MSEQRKKMIDALQQIVVPALREAGFKGSFPHFRRPAAGAIDLLTFQFDKWGGGFVIEIAKSAPTGITTIWGEQIAPNKVCAWHLDPAHRQRLKPGEGCSRLDWFRFDCTPSPGQPSIFIETAKSVLPFLESAQRWWSSSVARAEAKHSA